MNKQFFRRLARLEELLAPPNLDVAMVVVFIGFRRIRIRTSRPASASFWTTIVTAVCSLKPASASRLILTTKACVASRQVTWRTSSASCTLTVHGVRNAGGAERARARLLRGRDAWAVGLETWS